MHPSKIRLGIYLFLNLLCFQLAIGQANPVIVDSTISNFETIYFDKSVYQLTAVTCKQLDEVARLLKQKKDYILKVSGHSDNKGTEAANMRLSILRAEAVKKYLVSAGVENYRIKAVGYAGFQPLATNETEEGKAKNRRVQYRLIKK